MCCRTERWKTKNVRERENYVLEFLILKPICHETQREKKMTYFELQNIRKNHKKKRVTACEDYV